MNQSPKSNNSRARRDPASVQRQSAGVRRRPSSPDPKTSNFKQSPGTAGQVNRTAGQSSRSVGSRTAPSSGMGSRSARSSRPANSARSARSARSANSARSARYAKQRNDGYRFIAGTGILRKLKKPEKSGEEPILALTPRKQNAVIRSENRRQLTLAREADWQKQVVRTKGGVDIFLLVLILLLLALGSITVFSASYPDAIAKGNAGTYYIFKQLEYVLLGGAVMALAMVIPIRWYRKWAPLLVYGVACILLVAVLFMGTRAGVTERWISVGPINIQPSEIMKVGVILMLAWYADKYRDRMMELDFGWVSYRWNILYPCLILGLACGLVLIGKHLSGTFLVGMIGLLMLTVGGCRLTWLFISILPVGAAAGVLYIIANPYALKRFNTFANQADADKMDELYQTTQSLLAIGSGGLFGVGLGQSRQKYSYLTAAHTDFIFAIWCEEWGFLGAVLLIVLFLLFIWRGYVIAIRAPDKFTMLTAFGITTHVALQTFLNMYVATSLIFNTGVTLPFFSYGGSSTIVLMAEMGLLLCISRQSYRTKSDMEHDKLLRRAGLD